MSLVAVRRDNLLNDQVVGGLVIDCEDEGGAMCLHVGGFAVCEAAAVLHAAGGARLCALGHCNAAGSSLRQLVLLGLDLRGQNKGLLC